MRTRELRHLFPLIALAGVPVIAAGCVEAVIDTDCVDTLDRSYHFASPADPPLQFRIDRCRLDVDVCKELCQEALERDNILSTEPARCKVSFSGDSVSVDVSFEVFLEGDGCAAPLPEGPIFDTASGAPGLTAPTPIPAPASAALGLPTDPQARELTARTLDSLWNGGRSCHA